MTEEKEMKTLEEKISTHTPAWGVTSTCEKYAEYAKISTHTPAWGVTGWAISDCSNYRISTHTPAWGVTSDVSDVEKTAEDFNSHARVGRDRRAQTCQT